jgi:hypothetical protein
MDTSIREVNSSETFVANPELVTPATPKLTHRQRQVEELFELYDFLMLDSLLKRHPTPEEHTGS